MCFHSFVRNALIVRTGALIVRTGAQVVGPLLPCTSLRLPPVSGCKYRECRAMTCLHKCNPEVPHSDSHITGLLINAGWIQPQLPPTWVPLLISVNQLCKQSWSIYQPPIQTHSAHCRRRGAQEIGRFQAETLKKPLQELVKQMNHLYNKHSHYNQSTIYTLEYYAAMIRGENFFFL